MEYDSKPKMHIDMKKYRDVAKKDVVSEESEICFVLFSNIQTDIFVPHYTISPPLFYPDKYDQWQECQELKTVPKISYKSEYFKMWKCSCLGYFNSGIWNICTYL